MELNKSFVVGLILVLAGLAWIFLPQDKNQNQPPQTNEQTSLRPIDLYYYNQQKDQELSGGNIGCSREAVVPVNREIPQTITPIQDTIRLLMEGNLTEQEKQRGFSTEFPVKGLELKGADLNNGTLKLEFDDPNNLTSGGSCRVTVLWAQIEKTALQFPEVTKVEFIPESLFQP